MDERDFARFVFTMSVGRISYIAQDPSFERAVLSADPEQPMDYTKVELCRLDFIGLSTKSVARIKWDLTDGASWYIHI